jgi:hypothetical protein
MIACLDWSGAGEGSSSGRGGGKKSRGSAKGGKTSLKGGKIPPKGANSQPKDVAAVPDGDGALAPPMFVIPAGAPLPEAHRPALTDRAVQEVFARKRAAREKRIAEIVATAEKEGRPAERIIAAILHDAEHAPHSTNRRQLAEIGVECPPPGAIALPEADVTTALWRVIYGLAHLGIFLTGTDHLDDRQFLGVLCSRILEEEIRDVPPSRDMSEFIDLTPCRPDQPDGLTGPFDAEDDGDDGDAGEIARRGCSVVVARDALLPRPSREAI